MRRIGSGGVGRRERGWRGRGDVEQQRDRCCYLTLASDATSARRCRTDGERSAPCTTIGGARVMCDRLCGEAATRWGGEGARVGPVPDADGGARDSVVLLLQPQTSPVVESGLRLKRSEGAARM
ncbi:hypothetical protein VZT92_025050 [Zoarces viviparus]|uniref:Uncharacterized protein n=1 Tax=Zoarces viviparus TaxID=48416 RepID=A0AAW1E4E2_ZOAVI